MTAPRYVVEQSTWVVYVGPEGKRTICQSYSYAGLIAAALNAYNQPQEQEQKQEGK